MKETDTHGWWQNGESLRVFCRRGPCLLWEREKKGLDLRLRRRNLLEEKNSTTPPSPPTPPIYQSLLGSH